MAISIRTLRADEIEVRVQSTKENTKTNSVGAIMLLYKDARCDMRILDEVFGVTGWQRRHTRDNANCIVSIWDDEKKLWIDKEDTGTESNTEKEKGQASDSFKRACFNIGIGRELYTSPFIWINLEEKEWYKDQKGNIRVTERFSVLQIGYNDNKEIIMLEIADSKGKPRFTYGTTKKPTKKENTSSTKDIPTTEEQQTQEEVETKKIDKVKLESLQTLISNKGASTIGICKKYKINSLADMTMKMYLDAKGILEAAPDKEKVDLGL